jgi:hypothetical protein
MCCVSVRYYNFYDSVVFVLFLSDFRIVYDSQLFVVFLSDFRTVTTARYLLCFCQILELLRQIVICCVSVRF